MWSPWIIFLVSAAVIVIAGTRLLQYGDLTVEETGKERLKRLSRSLREMDIGNCGDANRSLFRHKEILREIFFSNLKGAKTRPASRLVYSYRLWRSASQN